VADRDNVCKTVGKTETTKWLKKVDLAEHARLFFEKRLTLDQLVLLTDVDMQALGLSHTDRAMLTLAIKTLVEDNYDHLMDFERDFDLEIAGFVAGPADEDDTEVCPPPPIHTHTRAGAHTHTRAFA
jgi:hypothetical protein